MNKSKVVSINKGRIMRIDQAWEAAHREARERLRVHDIERAWELASIEDEIINVWDRAQFENVAFDQATLRDERPSVHDEATMTERNVLDRRGPTPDTQVVPFAHEGEVETEGAGTDMIAEPQAVPPSGLVPIPLCFIQTALMCAAKQDIRYYLNGVYLHAVEGEFRIVATDGHRLVVSRYVPPKGVKIPEWAAKGIILPRDELSQALGILSRNSFETTRTPSGTVYRHGANDVHGTILLEGDETRAVVHCANRFASFAMKPVEGTFPDYARVLSGIGAAIVRGDEDGDVMHASAIDANYLRSAADMAQKLGAKSVHAFISKNDTASFFTFGGAPDSCLVIMPMRTGADAVSDGVVKMIGRGGVELSLAAYRAHLTRTTKLLEAAKDDHERAQLDDKRATFEKKIAHLIALTTPKHKALASKSA